MVHCPSSRVPVCLVFVGLLNHTQVTQCLRDQYLSMIPSISQTSLSVNESACRTQQASCPLPLPNMWANNDAYEVTDGPMTQSDQISATAWDRDYAALLDMESLGRHYKERITLHRNNDYADAVFLDWHAMSISANYTVNYSSDSGYTVDTGFVSEPQGHESCSRVHRKELTKPSCHSTALTKSYNGQLSMVP